MTCHSVRELGNVLCRADNKLRDDVTDFVWCLENSVNEDEHEAAFPSVPVPRSADEDADEPDDWNAGNG